MVTKSKTYFDFIAPFYSISTKVAAPFYHASLTNYLETSAQAAAASGNPVA